MYYLFIVLFIVVLCCIGFLIYVYSHTNTVKIVDVHINFNLPHPIKLVQLTDLHNKTSYKNGQLAMLVNKLDPDIVTITGDLATHQNKLDNVLREIANIKQTHKFFVPGNYERETAISRFKKRKLTSAEYTHNVKRISKVATYLDNKTETIRLHNTAITLLGCDNSIYGYETVNRDFVTTQTQLKLILAHSPQIMSMLENQQVDYNLLMVGHTHGGQIRLFNKTFGRYKHYHIGLKRLANHRYFYISKGLGTVKLPIRFNCSPEITVFHLS